MLFGATNSMPRYVQVTSQGTGIHSTSSTGTPLIISSVTSVSTLWGSPYLTRDFFHSIGSKMGDQVLLVVAEEGDEFVAGALNLIGGDTLFGRLWGCLPQTYYPSLHFEACYYQAIEAAIELNLKTVEAGAQGEHKIQRGYLPVTTYSCHYIVDENFRKAIDDFLVREAAQVPFQDKIMWILTHNGQYLREPASVLDLAHQLVTLVHHHSCFP